nr:MerR family transcriptional regulator [Microcella indica]
MGMSELSAATGATVPTLKFYLRAQLLHAALRTSPNQAQYDDSHVERVRLVRALLEVGGLSVAQAARVIGALDSDVPLSSVFGVAQRAVSIPSSPREDRDASSELGEGARLIAELCARRGWRVHANNPGLAIAARVIGTYADLGLDALTAAVLEPGAEAADLVARADLDGVAQAGPDPAAMTRVVAVGTVLGDSLAAGLRRIAQEAESFRRFPLPAGVPAPEPLTAAAIAAHLEEDC